ncbi:MAG: DAK2 domain-containing protein [Clostridia bacterium]|nr:DAK2 domain-containing protein [Clostridia bacterium]
MVNGAINAATLQSFFVAGAANLLANKEYVNSINVFPIPDGDTGTNMYATVSGAVNAGKNAKDKLIGEYLQIISKAAVMNARGNSGVILSQFFKGMAVAAGDKEELSAKDFAHTLEGAWEKAYAVVKNATEGTMLTVMREAQQNTPSCDDVAEYLAKYCSEAATSLKHTPELLPVLKKAGVLDSGGAGFLYIAEGMLKAARGEKVEGGALSEVAATVAQDAGAFNADSELTFGYCTEFILQLQNSKVDVKDFPLSTVTDYLDEVKGESVVAFKDDDVIKVHVHTFDPGKILSEMRKYGEFLTVKIENMNLQHSENIDYFKDMEDEGVKDGLNAEQKKYATVVVASGEGICRAFTETGVDKVVSGGQTMNTSIQDFIDAFDSVNAENILVYPNNPNIIMAATLAAENYKKAKVIVIPTKTLAEGYSAISMLDLTSEPDEIISGQKEVINSVETVEVTYSVRDTTIDGIDVKKGDNICISGKKLLSCAKKRTDAVIDALCALEDFKDKQLMTVITGSGVSDAEFEEICQKTEKLNPLMEIFRIDGKQDVYSYIIGLE